MVSSLVQAKWFILGCIIATPPADIAWVLVGSSLSPMPMLKVPEITVTCLIAGCECAGILKSAGSLMRKVKGTASFSGPSMTAICAPGGNAGTSVHLRSEGVTNACPSAAYAGGDRKTQSPPKLERLLLQRVSSLPPLVGVGNSQDARAPAGAPSVRGA